VPVSAEVRARCHQVLSGEELQCLAAATLVGFTNAFAAGDMAVLVAVTRNEFVVLSCSRARGRIPERILASYRRKVAVGLVDQAGACHVRLGSLELEVEEADVAPLLAAAAETANEGPEDPFVT